VPAALARCFSTAPRGAHDKHVAVLGGRDRDSIARMALPTPALPPYDVRAWQRRPFAERLKMVCGAWAIQGYGTPWPIYIVYLLKVAFYVGMWCFFCSFSTGLGAPLRIASWWAEPEALQKAVLWSMMFESLGLGCGSGPLTGRYYPPLGGVLYFLRPGTTKMPLFPGLPILGGDRRTILDVALYLTHHVFLARALIAPALEPSLIVPTLILLPILGLADKTLFLSSRAEHYGSALVCCLFPGSFLAGAKVVWVAVWLWAATSKLNGHFPSVVAVMQSNSPLTAVGSLRKRLYRSYPDDLRPSSLARAMAHGGTVLEYAFPITLLASGGGPVTPVALGVMLIFHIFITSSVPMGVPIEWNVIMVYGAFLLFGHHAEVSVLSIGSPLLWGYLAVACFLVQLVGNLFPAHVSFLCSMRYYAGNWAYSVWLFKGDSSTKLDRGLVKMAPRVQDQLAKFYDEITNIAVLSKVMAFRAMHLHGRALQLLLPKAVGNIEALDGYEYLDGEIVAGVVLGWNFGEGHLHDLQLLRAVQRQCGFEEGELRCIFVESQPFGRPRLAWTIADAATGVREKGEVGVAELEELQPWPAAPAGVAAASA
jgi:hypothetical protein